MHSNTRKVCSTFRKYNKLATRFDRSPLARRLAANERSARELGALATANAITRTLTAYRTAILDRLLG